jgi:hypothetical protein
MNAWRRVLSVRELKLRALTSLYAIYHSRRVRLRNQSEIARAVVDSSVPERVKRTSRVGPRVRRFFRGQRSGNSFDRMDISSFGNAAISHTLEVHAKALGRSLGVS